MAPGAGDPAGGTPPSRVTALEATGRSLDWAGATAAGAASDAHSTPSRLFARVSSRVCSSITDTAACSFSQLIQGVWPIIVPDSQHNSPHSSGPRAERHGR